MTSESPHFDRHQGRDNRRRDARIPMGLPVEVHLSDSETALTVELMDLAVGGARFQADPGEVRLDQRASFVFFTPGGRACAAEGPIVRIETNGEFIVALQNSNTALVTFIKAIASSLLVRADSTRSNR